MRLRQHEPENHRLNDWKTVSRNQSRIVQGLRTSFDWETFVYNALDILPPVLLILTVIGAFLLAINN